MTISTIGETSESWISAVETIASPKPIPIVSAFTRQGPGKSLMLAPIAPSVAGCPAPNPNISEETSVTVATEAATLSPLAMCCPTKYLSSVEDRNQCRMARVYRVSEPN